MENERFYNKLVRDKIPQIIESNGKNEVAFTRLLDNTEYGIELNKKLQEEVQEYLADESLEEMADILEVIHGLLLFKNKTFANLEQVRKEKAEKRGGFEKRIFLEKVKTRQTPFCC